ncbi:PREDICTED: uncharacterized protein LOC100640036 isoform X1 [Amphimedon queenslandica]|nr:PREDICTED: uncharacterized protein LOC100640036 isoform X1 [Amphimedon queenslandica]|eukprot:XP_019851963.1 PREDICTED: uncharacterized protein LOC100640036 isoform X1 [Amphimedon queenslandica]
MTAACIEVPYRVRTGSNGGTEERRRLIDSRGGTKWGNEENQGRTTGAEKEKHRKHIDAILKAWESIVAKDKEERHAKLREKVELQRQLISKVQEQNEAIRCYKMEKKKEKEEMEQLAVELELKGRKKSTYKSPSVTKRLKPSVSAPMIQLTDTHIKNDTTGQEPMEAKRRSTAAPVSRRSKTPLTSSYIRIPHDVHSINEGSGPASPVLPQFPENKVLQYLGIEQSHMEQVKIEEMWLHMKSHSEKQLHPMQEHLERLKMMSCPSIKECLELYDQPTACDNYTGKTISLTAALKTLRTISEPTKEYILRLSKSSASLKSKCGQQMIENTAKKRPDKDDIGNNAWFVGLDKSKGQRPQSAPAPLLVSKRAAPLKTSPAGPVAKTRATSALPRTYCFQSEEGCKKRGSIKKPLTSWSQRRNSSRLMNSGSAVSKSTATTKKKVVAVTKNNVTFPSQWEPLSLAALREANGVLKREGSGHGAFRNGRVTLWKQSIT